LRVLVTGGTGYLGAAIVRALIDRGHAPIVFARGAAQSASPGTLITGDVRDRAAIARAAQGVDAICHTAALVSIWRPRREEFDEINIGGLQNVLDACATLRIPKLVYTSSFLALPPADAQRPLQANDYQRTKVAARHVARAAIARGLPVVTLVPGVVYGPGPVTEGNLIGRLVRDHLEGRLPGVVGADRRWCYSYVEDVAQAHVAALERGQPGTEYVCGGENAPQMRVFEILREVAGARLPRRIPFAVAAAAGWLNEVRAGLTGRPPLLTRGVVDIFRHDWSLPSPAGPGALIPAWTPLDTGLRSTLSGLGIRGRS
jgi:farnesol dehydrogenase